MEIVRSKAPLRLGLAGGGTDVSPFCDLYGGQILNATINLYAYCSLIPGNTGSVSFQQEDEVEELEAVSHYEPTGKNTLLKAVYNRVVRDFNRGQPISHRLITTSDAPPGSGLGSSSTVIVTMLQAYAELLHIPLSEYDIASLAYKIERQDLGQKGGHQDQYAAAFGGINFMEFFEGDRVLVNPLRVKNWILSELESSILLYYSKVSRYSSEIIEEQVKTIKAHDETALKATMELKIDALGMKEALLTGKIRRFATLLGKSWESKKQLAKSISNESIAKIMDTAMEAGAYSGKVSGAGGGGFVILMINPLDRRKVELALKDLPGYTVPFQFTQKGAVAWRVRRGSEGAI